MSATRDAHAPGALARSTQAPATHARIARRLLLALAAGCLFAGIAGGLVRLGVALPAGAPAAAHGALMICGFLGTVIALERAVAWGRPWAYAAPLASAAGAVALVAAAALADDAALARPLALAADVLLVAAPLALAAVAMAILRRQKAAHNAVLLVAVLAWLAGNVLFALGAAPDTLAAWWLAFVVLTIAAERLELTRLRRRPTVALPLFHACAALVLAGAALVAFQPWGDAAYGAGLLATCLWLVAFDIARHTVRGNGYARYAAYALLAGYAWLAAAAVAWMVAPLSAVPPRDLALHAIGLGFALSMIFAHAPVIAPAVARVRMRYTPVFYVPLVALHASLVLRLWAGLHDPGARRTGAWLDVAAVIVFVATLVYAARSSRRGSLESRTPHLHGAQAR